MTTRFDDPRRFQFVVSLGVHNVYRDAGKPVGEARLYLSACARRNNAIATVDKIALRRFKTMSPQIPHVLSLKTLAREIDIDLTSLDPCEMDLAHTNSPHHTFDLDMLGRAILRTPELEHVSFSPHVVLEDSQKTALLAFLLTDPDLDHMVNYLREHKLDVFLAITGEGLTIEGPNEHLASVA